MHGIHVAGQATALSEPCVLSLSLDGYKRLWTPHGEPLGEIRLPNFNDLEVRFSCFFSSSFCLAPVRLVSFRFVSFVPHSQHETGPGGRPFVTTLRAARRTELPRFCSLTATVQPVTVAVAATRPTTMTWTTTSSWLICRQLTVNQRDTINCCFLWKGNPGP